MRDGLTLGANVGLVANRWADRPAFVTDEGDRYTFREFDDEVNAVARGLREHGIGHGDRVGLVLPNSIEYVVVYFATQKLGAVAVPINYRNAPADVSHILSTADADVLVYDSAFEETVATATDDVDLSATIATGTSAYASLRDFDTAAVECPAERADLSYLAHTSGSTGRPKLIPHTHDDAMLGGFQGVHEMGLRRDDVGLSLAPLFHTAGMYTFFVPHLFVGATTILQREFDPETSLELIDDENATGVFAVPAQYRAMLRATDPSAYDLSSVRHVRTGASKMSQETIDTLTETFADDFYNTYGLTECQQNVTIATPDDPPSKAVSIGKASYFWNLRVVEPAEPGTIDIEAEVSPPGTGLLLVSGPMTMTGYVDQPEKTAETLLDGWVYTGDIVDVDADGFLHVVDRVDNMLKSGGENVYPQEVERVLERHPGVVESGVFGRDHVDWGQAVVAAVVLESGVGTDELDAHLTGSNDLADYKRPREYFVVDEIPRGPSGSIRREALSALAE